jgi:flagellar basal-body rod modification protein FlgD
MGSAPQGSLNFSWDGLNDSGDYAPPGLYNIQVEAIQNDRAVDLQTKLFSKVESVNLSGGNGLTLNLEGLGPIAFNNVQQIY